MQMNGRCYLGWGHPIVWSFYIQGMAQSHFDSIFYTRTFRPAFSHDLSCAVQYNSSEGTELHASTVIYGHTLMSR